MGTPIYCWLVRSTGDNLDPQLALKRGQSCGTEPVTCGVCTNSLLVSELNRILGRTAGVQSC